MSTQHLREASHPRAEVPTGDTMVRRKAFCLKTDGVMAKMNG